MELQLVMEAEIKILIIKMYQTRDILEDKEIILDLRMKTMAEAVAAVPVVLEEMVRAHRLEELVVMERLSGYQKVQEIQSQEQVVAVVEFKIQVELLE